jgi:hypothetical protein
VQIFLFKLSRRVDAIFWHSVSVLSGVMQCIMVGKNSSIVENDLVLEFEHNFRLWARLLSSIVIVNPTIVTPRAVSFRYGV